MGYMDIWGTWTLNRIVFPHKPGFNRRTKAAEENSSKTINRMERLRFEPLCSSSTWPEYRDPMAFGRYWVVSILQHYAISPFFGAPAHCPYGLFSQQNQTLWPLPRTCSGQILIPSSIFGSNHIAVPSYSFSESVEKYKKFAKQL